MGVKLLYLDSNRALITALEGVRLQNTSQNRDVWPHIEHGSDVGMYFAWEAMLRCAVYWQWRGTILNRGSDVTLCGVLAVAGAALSRRVDVLPRRPQ